MVNGLLSALSNKLLQDKMRMLVKEFNQLAENDRTLSMQERQGSTMVVALRRWRYSLFDQFVR